MRTQTDRMVRCCWIAGAVLVLGCATDDDLDASTGELEAPLVHEAPLAHEASLVQGLASCTQEADCSGGLTCIEGACRPCFAHDQCRSDVCDQGAATPMGPGACVPESSVNYVDASARPACETGDGSRTNPVCEIRDAIPRAIGARYAIRVYPGYYRPFGATDRTFWVFGPGNGTAIVGEEDLTAGARIRAGARVVLDGLDFGVHVLTGVVCEGASLKVLRGRVQGDYQGIRATDCDLIIDRVRARGAILSGLVVAGTGTYRVSNSYFSGGDHQAVVFSGSSTGKFLFNTVTRGGELHPGGIDCGTSPRTIRDSIVVGSFPAADGAQTIGACTHQRVVVGSGDLRTDPGLIYLDPELDAEGRLLATPANDACCIDKGARYVSSLYRDFFGTPRFCGTSNDIGAHEHPEPGCVD
jgi:hypothetical protein